MEPAPEAGRTPRRFRVRRRGATRIDPITLAVAGAYRRYLRHRVLGLEHLRASFASGHPVVLVGNHCLDVTDPALFAVAVYRELGRFLPSIGHQILFFDLPFFRPLARSWGVIPSRRPGLAERALRREGALLLYPGAGQEAALRSYRREPYTLKWYARTGFVELALRTGATIHFVAGIGVDELYYQTDWRVPEALFRIFGGEYGEEYRGLRAQVGAAGLHVLPGIFPLPVRITHVVSPPLSLDLSIDPGDREGVEAAHVKIWAECQEMLDTLVSARDHESDVLDRAVRSGIHVLQTLGI